LNRSFSSAAGGPLGLGLRTIAVGLAFFGQLALAHTGAASVPLAIRCYAVAIALWLIATARPGPAAVPLLPRSGWRRVPRAVRLRRAIWLQIAVALCLLGVALLRSRGYDSPVGALAWLAGVVLLALALRAKRDATPARAAGGERVSGSELGLFLLILAVGVVFRFHRLGDWFGGIHGDECEAGLDALRILRGERVPPLATGWFGQGNLYYWGVALGMKLAGTDLAGLRVFSALCGVLLLLPTYGLARRWFGPRVALLSAAFLAISDVAVNFSRLEFSNVTTPLSLAAGFAFFYLGLRSGRPLDFLLAGFAHAAGLYFYQGARLTPLLGLAFLAYLLLALPFLAAAGKGRRELRRQLLRSRRLSVPALVYVVGLLSFAAPFVAFSVDNHQQATGRLKDKLVFNNEARMARTHRLEHGPLFLGVRAPRATDALPLPVRFEETGASVQVARDGFWPRVLWRQLVVTLSVLTLRQDESSVYTFAGAPITKPFEAVLIVLSLAWALVRARDPRCATLAIWFWGTVVAGGVLTIDAPYVARLVGILPVLAISAAMTLDRLAAALEAVLGRAGRAAASCLIAVVLLALTGQNFTDYFHRYTRSSPLPFAAMVGQAAFVRETHDRAALASTAPPRYYDLGAHVLYWPHSINRFLNPSATGRDLANLSQELPLEIDTDAEAIFLIWDHNQHYLPILESLYPGGQASDVRYGPAGHRDHLFTSYRVPAAELARAHTTLATFQPSAGTPVTRLETGFGTVAAPPANLDYPVRASWKGAILAPSFARYRVDVVAAPGGAAEIASAKSPATPVPDAALRIDGAAVPPAGELVLARGLHRVELTARLPGPEARVRLRWGVAAFGTRGLARRFVWSPQHGSFRGFVRGLPPGETASPYLGSPRFDGLPLLSARIDSFLGFLDAGRALAPPGRPFVARWTTTLRVSSSGTARFELHANRGALLLVDGRTLIQLPDSGPEASRVVQDLPLEAGPHRLEVWYSWPHVFGVLELFWTPPGGSRRLLGFEDAEAPAGAWPPAELSGAEEAAPDLGETRSVRSRGDLDLRRLAREPRALAVTSGGELLVADSGGHRVVRLDAGGRFLGAFGRAGRGAGEFERLEDVAVGPHGRIYTLDSGFGRVQVFSKDGTLLRTLGEDAGMCTPAGFGVGADGAVYVADTCRNRIVRLGGKERPFEEIVPAPPAKLEQPVDVAVGPDGLLYVADLTPRVIALDPRSGAVVRTWPVAVGTDEGGSNLALAGTRLYMSDPDRGVVQAIDVAGNELGKLRGDPADPFAGPLAVACSPGNELHVIDRGGARLQTFADPLAETTR